MLTISVVSWFSAIALTIISAYNVTRLLVATSSFDIEHVVTMTVLGILLWSLCYLPGLVLSIAIYHDVTGEILDGYRWEGAWLIPGGVITYRPLYFVLLALSLAISTSVAFFVVKQLHKSSGISTRNGYISIVGSIVAFISLVAAILGIISFYLDYLA